MRKEYRGTTHEAAIVRTALALNLQMSVACNYAEKFYGLYHISGERSYEALRQYMIENPDSIDVISTYCLDAKENFLDFFSVFMLLRQPEKPKLLVHHHGVESKIIGNGETATFIEYPEESWTDLKKDFETARHLKPLLRLDSKDTEKDVLLIKAPDQNTGFTALKYIAAYLRSTHTAREWDKITNKDFLEDTDFDFHRKMPIVNFNVISSYSPEKGNDNIVSFENIQGIGANEKGTPYFLKNELNPLCVIINSRDSFSFSVKKLKYLEERSHLVLLVIPFLTQMEQLFGNTALKDREEITSELEFHYACNTLAIKAPEIGDGYYEALLQDFALLCKCRLHSDLNTLELLSTIKKTRKKLDAPTLEKSILNAYRRSGRKSVLTREDFAFLEGRPATVMEKNQLSAKQKLSTQIIGQEKAKKQILEALACNKINALRTQVGLPDSANHNVFAFIGAPGTAKTTVAQIIGEIMMEEKLLPGNRLISLSGAQLKAQYLGQTAHLVQSIFQNHDIIILDEIYGLTSGNSTDSYAQEALAQLCLELEEHGREKLICFLGYGGDVNAEDNKMKVFIESNPGIASRINHIINFESYDPYKDMPEILKGIADNHGFKLSENSLRLAAAFFALRAQKRDFGNGREARRLLQHAIKHQAVRLQEANQYTKDDLEQISEDDINQAVAEILQAGADLEGRPQTRIGFTSDKSQRGKQSKT